MTDYLSLDTTRCDEIALAHIDQRWLRGENELYRTKWLDYRFYHPLKATVLFAEAYVQAVKAAIKRRYSIYKGMNARVLKDPDLFANAPTTVTGLWKARRLADQHGVPYDFWCRWAMNYAEARDWLYLPKPTQLYSVKPYFDDDVSMVEFIVDRWEVAKRERPVYAVSDFYRVEAWTGHPYQVAHQRALIERIKHSPLPEIDVATLVLEEGLLSEQALFAVFGASADTLLQRAQQYACNP